MEYGGQGLADFRYNAVMSEEVVGCGIAGDTFVMHNDIVAAVPAHADQPRAEAALAARLHRRLDW